MLKYFYFKKIALSLGVIFFVFSFMEKANAQEFNWVKSYGGTQKDKGTSLGIDQFGNQYIAGFFRNEMMMGNIDLHATGGAADEDIFITKMDIDGNPVWGHSFGNGLNQAVDIPFSLSSNENGFTAATGKAFGYLKMDNGDSLPGFGMEDMWLVTYDPDGNLNWAKLGGGSNDDFGSAVYMDNNNNVYCVGNCVGDMNFYGDSMITVVNDRNIFCAKYSCDGNLQWVHTIGSESAIQVHDMVVDGSGNMYMSGSYRHTANFGIYQFTSLGDADGFVLKMEPSGNIVWAKTFGSDIPYSDESGAAISLDASGNCYVAGVFAGNCIFESGQISATNAKNVFLAAFDNDGNYLWGNAIKGSADSKFSPITLSMRVEDNILLTGIFTGVITAGSIELQPYVNLDSSDAFIASFNTLGEVNWAIHVGGSGNDGAFGIAGNGSSFAFAVGNFRNMAQFGPNTIISNGLSDMWVAKFQKNVVTQSGLNVDFSNGIQPYPNPFSDQFSVNIPAQTTDIFAYNKFGQAVYHRQILPGEREVSIDFSVPASGIYTLQFKGDYGLMTRLIEKQSY